MLFNSHYCSLDKGYIGGRFNGFRIASGSLHRYATSSLFQIGSPFCGSIRLDRSVSHKVLAPFT
jgi:hypothetical protein